MGIAMVCSKYIAIVSIAIEVSIAMVSMAIVSIAIAMVRVAQERPKYAAGGGEQGEEAPAVLHT